MFESIVGQDLAVEQMSRALKRPVNTYVFYGSRGTFVEESARIFASRLIESSGELDERISKKLFADVIEFVPMGTNYRIKEDVRGSMLQEFRKSPVEGVGKVLIVHDAHLLREDSANTLLKSLEETSENLYWILIAPSPDLLISTIRSRSYEIEFDRLHADVVESILLSEGIRAEKAKDISNNCSGRIDRARLLANFFSPLKKCAVEVVSKISNSGSSISTSAQQIVDTFDEIASDIVAQNKTELSEIKSTMKDSGYSDKVAKSIVSTSKTRLEAGEKRLRHELLLEFLDVLGQEYAKTLSSNSGGIEAQNSALAFETINDYKKRLVYNPSELLFLESLLASIETSKLKVNS
ncbi:MAG TPA: hypothetical protein PLT55_02715 [Acidimicrobiia bacterium]|nr:hypothetical protein [Acidimicrobiia bacterium]